MNDVIISMILVIFPIMMYLVFSCYNLLANKKIEKIVFIITILTSLYISFCYNVGKYEMLLFCNIPILICYFKKESLFGKLLYLIVCIFS